MESIPLDEYEERCEKYFIQEYLKRINELRLHRNDCLPHLLPIEDDSHRDGANDILPYLLNDDRLFVVQRTIRSDFPTTARDRLPGMDKWRRLEVDCNLPKRFWEAYRRRPEEWAEILREAGQSNFFRETLWRNTWDLSHLSLDAYQAKLGGVQDNAIRRMCNCIRELQNSLASVGLGDLWTQRGEFFSPFSKGLSRYVQRGVPFLIPRLLHASWQHLAPSSRRSLPSISRGRPDFKHESPTAILFSTAGTGKTRMLLDLLNQKYGMYIIAPGGPLESRDPQDATSPDPAILQPFRGGASKDTLSLWESVRRAPVTAPPCYIQIYARTLVVSRLLTFEAFLNISPQYQNRQNAEGIYRWMLLQINCSHGFDVFDAVWRLVRFNIEYNLTVLGNPDPRFDGLIWCIDEAQVALEDPIAEEMFKMIWYECRELREGEDLTVVLSGTSLRLSTLLQLVHQGATPHQQALGSEYYHETYSIVTDVPLISSVIQFWQLYERHMGDLMLEVQDVGCGNPNIPSLADYPLHARAGRSLGFELNQVAFERLQIPRNVNQTGIQDLDQADFRTAINRYCPVFFGRYRWSTLFIEQIMRQATFAQMSIDSIERAAADASRIVKDALKTRLSHVPDRSWVDQLYLMAIKADVYCQSSIIMESSARLVEEGFALMDGLPVRTEGSTGVSGSQQDVSPTTNFFSRVSLCEPLAVQAVIAHLREHGQYDIQVMEFFKELHIDNRDQGAIGKTTEYVLATKLDNFLQKPVDPTKADPMNGPYRKSFWNVLSGAQNITAILAKNTNTVPSYDNYYLDDPKGLLSSMSTLDRSMPIPLWIQLTLRDEQRPKILFPTKEEGPDLVFFLQNGAERRLCAIQSKTGKDLHQKAKLKEGIHSLIKWLSGRRSEFSGKIVLIYVLTSTTIKKGVFGERVREHLSETSDLQQTLRDMSDRVYLCYLDRSNAVSVWGEVFCDLIIKMKGLD
ncbi:MAG: hypothetical protein Q9161_008515 [Pseudevernia consocians]